MSDEQRKDEEAEVEGHSRRNAMNDEPRDDEGEVEGHSRRNAMNDEPAGEGDSDNDVEAHTRKANIPRKF